MVLLPPESKRGKKSTIFELQHVFIEESITGTTTKHALHVSRSHKTLLQHQKWFVLLLQHVVRWKFMKKKCYFLVSWCLMLKKISKNWCKNVVRTWILISRKNFWIKFCCKNTFFMLMTSVYLSFNKFLVSPLQVRFWELKGDVTSSQLLVHGGECVDLKWKNLLFFWETLLVNKLIFFFCENSSIFKKIC